MTDRPSLSSFSLVLNRREVFVATAIRSGWFSDTALIRDLIQLIAEYVCTPTRMSLVFALCGLSGGVL